MTSTKQWAFFILLSCILLVILNGYVTQTNTHGNAVDIILDGQLVKTIPLSENAPSTTFTISGPHITNVLEVTHGRVRVVEANCPDQVCVHQGWLTSSLRPIVCLPNNMVIRFAERQADTSHVDGVSQ